MQILMQIIHSYRVQRCSQCSHPSFTLNGWQKYCLTRNHLDPSIVDLDGDLLAGLLVQSKGHRGIGSLANLLPHLGVEHNRLYILVGL